MRVFQKLIGLGILAMAVFMVQGCSFDFLKTDPASRCNKGEIDSCMNQGYYWATQIGMRDYKKAASFYQKACNLGEPRGCWKAGLAYTRTENYQPAFLAYQKTCNLNVGGGCTEVGLFYAKGLGTRQDYQEAYTLFQKACDLDDAQGCVALGNMYDFEVGVKQDLDKAKNLYGKACDLGYQMGCNNYRAFNLGNKRRGTILERSIDEGYFD